MPFLKSHNAHFLFLQKKLSQQKLVFAFDWDGTISGDIEKLRRVLKHLHTVSGGKICIITARNVAYIDARLKEKYPVIGGHGCQIRLDPRKGISRMPGIAPFDETLRQTILSSPLLMQDDVKILYRPNKETATSLCVVYKGCFKNYKYWIQETLDRMVKEYDYRAVKNRGPSWDIIPNTIDKGKALAYLMDQPPFKGSMAVTFGDTKADVAMHEIAHYGFSVQNNLVSTIATLKNPDRTIDFLALLSEFDGSVSIKQHHLLSCLGRSKQCRFPQPAS